MRSRLLPLAGLLSALALPAAARTLAVGPGQEFARPSAAARVAQDGDTVLIAPGQYYDCAIWTRSRLTIAGTGPDTVLTDTTCQGKALFVVMGNDTTIRDLTFARARVPDGNGAGIRLEGQGLTLERVQFLNDQVGLLSGAAGPGEIRIADCQFRQGGRGGVRPLYAVMVGPSRLLRIERSRFAQVEGGQVSSAADHTELVGNEIATGTGEAPAVAVLAAGGALTMTDNRLSIGPNAPRLAAAVLAMGQGTVAMRGNSLVNETGQPAALLLNWTGNPPAMADNHLAPGDTALSSHGLWRHRASTLFYATKDAARALAGRLKRRVMGMLAH